MAQTLLHHLSFNKSDWSRVRVKDVQDGRIWQPTARKLDMDFLRHDLPTGYAKWVLALMMNVVWCNVKKNKQTFGRYTVVLKLSSTAGCEYRDLKTTI